MKDALKEADHQKLIFEWAALNYGKYPELRFMYHTPNGGSRNVIEAVNLKAQGVRSGVPDICLPVPKGKYHGLYIELKRYGGKPTAYIKIAGRGLKMGLNKYHAKQTMIDGITFPSKLEANRYQELKLLERAGLIHGLVRQAKYTLIEKSKHGREICYIADFVYTEGNKTVVEDTKGFKTPVYNLKKRMMAEKYGILIKEVAK